MNRQSLPMWVALSAIIALLVGTAAGFLTHVDDASPAQALLTAGAWAGGCFLGAVALITLLLPKG
ncbi:hypothetical protein LO763_18630 [Glycomyces sp. A-F 0318]|uniref:hypothetical protein n=1 Tax=Glycomyces amatae TaxID=2881355 RepID=UPI001E475B54|nr:hypothetical protein [Glycomyces amatae]MCD0445626.1 hypothetical protein [Glycomyces amatae]